MVHVVTLDVTSSCRIPGSGYIFFLFLFLKERIVKKPVKMEKKKKKNDLLSDFFFPSAAHLVSHTHCIIIIIIISTAALHGTCLCMYV